MSYSISTLYMLSTERSLSNLTEMHFNSDTPDLNKINAHKTNLMHVQDQLA